MNARADHQERGRQIAEALTAILSRILPTDPESRRIARTHAAYYTLVLGDPALLADHGTAQPDLREGYPAEQVRAAQRDGAIAADRDPEATAAGLAAMVNGLGSSVLGARRTRYRFGRNHLPDGEAALRILRYHLDEPFTV